MQNILIAAFGSVGDVLPFIGIGSELRKRGHDVTLIGNPYFAPHAAEARLVLSPVGTVADYQEVMSDSRLFHWKTALDPRRLSHFVHIVEPVYEAIVRLHDPGRTVLFASGTWSGIWIAVEKCGVPFVGGVVTPSRLPSRYDPPHPPWPLPAWAARLAQTQMGLRFLYGLKGGLNKVSRLRRSAAAPPPPANPLLDEINRVRTSLQLSEISGPENTGFSSVRLPVPQRIVCMWPGWFADRQGDWPAEAQVTGFPFYPQSGAQVESIPPRRNGAEVREQLVFTTGSAACQQQAFFTAAVEACRILKRSGLLVTPNADQVPRPLPPAVTHITYAPFGELFARSALVVHHGGIGTIALALAAGVPQVVRPIMGEQFDLGNRVQRLGVGRMITDSTIAPVQLAKVIDSLLSSERVSKRCQHWQARVDRRNGLTRAADAIESVAGSSRLRFAAG